MIAGGLIAAATLAGAASAETYYMTRNAGIPGHNQETHSGVTAQGCLDLCTDRAWCRSADYERAARKCYLQPVNKKQVALRTDYPQNPFDHYTRDFAAQCGARLSITGKGSAALIRAARKNRAERRAKRAWTAYVGGAEDGVNILDLLGEGWSNGIRNPSFGLGTRYADLDKAKNVVTNCDDGTVMHCTVTATPCAW